MQQGSVAVIKWKRCNCMLEKFKKLTYFENGMKNPYFWHFCHNNCFFCNCEPCNKNISFNRLPLKYMLQ